MRAGHHSSIHCNNLFCKPKFEHKRSAHVSLVGFWFAREAPWPKPQTADRCAFMMVIDGRWWPSPRLLACRLMQAKVACIAKSGWRLIQAGSFFSFWFNVFQLCNPLALVMLPMNLECRMYKFYRMPFLFLAAVWFLAWFASLVPCWVQQRPGCRWDGFQTVS